MARGFKKCIVLLSGGLDSATTLFYARQKGFTPFGLIFDYGQRHKKEITNAVRIAKRFCKDFKVVKITLPWKGSALLDTKISLPKKRNLDKMNAAIPSTYVPARNIIFLSFAASYAEAIGASVIFIGANQIDYSGYPDCRPAFFKAYEEVLKKGAKSGVEGKRIHVQTPLVHLTKAEIIKLGIELKVPYELTWSCYAGGRVPCGVCDSCILRKKGFDKLNLKDPAL